MSDTTGDPDAIRAYLNEKAQQGSVVEPVAQNRDWYSRDHVALHVDELKKLVGMDGEVLRVWLDDDGEYVHVMTVGEGENFVNVVKGGYTEARSPWNDRRPPR